MLPIKKCDITITSRPEDLREGLFGQVLLYVFEILPYLRSQNIFPNWKIAASHYGTSPGGWVVPGVVDVAYRVESGGKKNIDLLQLRNQHRHLLGNDWRQLSALWNEYFCIPRRITENAAKILPLSNVLGIHYRGNDKLWGSWDSNPVSHEDFLRIIREFLKQRPAIDRIFLATDDFNFYQFLKRNVSLEIINLGEVLFHKEETAAEKLSDKTDRAMLDCLLLSHCAVVLQTCSALAAFAKIFNPDLETYRVAASKFHGEPYFPVAYIAPYGSASSEIAELVDRLMSNDWTRERDVHRFALTFVAIPCPPRSNAVFVIKRWIREVEVWPGLKWLEQFRVGIWKLKVAIKKSRHS
jgi:hypothetical protein